MNIQTVFEGKRGCGYRKPGGLYLRTDGHGRYCGALPIELTVCPTCAQGIKPARGWTWINLAALVAVRGCSKGSIDEDWTTGCGDCPIADAKIQDVGLIWIGEKFYPTPEDFNRESHTLGLSRRITAVPHGFKLGETWVSLAHRKAIPDGNDEQGKAKFKAAIFHVFMPSRIEYVVKADDAEEKLEALEKRGITLVKVINPEPAQLALPEPELQTI
jgi:hypothetical protein